MNKFFSLVKGSAMNVAFYCKQHSPEILAISGTIGVVTSMVLIGKASFKMTSVIDAHNENMDKIKATAASFLGEKYTEEDITHDKTVAYGKTIASAAKLYAPGVIVGALSITALLTSNKILRERNIALAAAFAAVDKSFKEYRKRVVEKYGKDVDYKLRHNIKEVEITEEVVDENGEIKTETKTVEVKNDGASDFSVIINEENSYLWSNDLEYMEMTLNLKQRYFNSLLIGRTTSNHKGTVFLNEVCDELGIEHTAAGQQVGWMYDGSEDSDNYIDFRIKQIYTENENGDLRPAFILDFNVDGNILKLMK